MSKFSSNFHKSGEEYNFLVYTILVYFKDTDKVFDVIIIIIIFLCFGRSLTMKYNLIIISSDPLFCIYKNSSSEHFFFPHLI